MSAETSIVQMRWPDDGQDAWWSTADKVARGLAATTMPVHASDTPARSPDWLDSMHGLGWASLCADRAHGGQGQSAAVLCRVLEALSAVHASAAATVYASAASHMVLNLCELPPERRRLMRDLVVHWLAWPAFHDIDEQLWPAVDAQGYLRGQVDLLLGGMHAQWAVLPALLRDQTVGMVLVDLRHPAVIRGSAVSTLGLVECGMGDVEFGGVPCELLSAKGHEVYAALTGRLAPAALAMYAGVARASLDVAAHHAATRKQGGGPLNGWGEVRRVLAHMHERLSVMQGLLCAALASDAGVPWEGARHTTLHAGQLVCEQASDGVQVLGGSGYVNDAPQAQRLCDAHQLRCLMGGVAWRRQRLIDQAMHAFGHQRDAGSGVSTWSSR